MLHYSDLLCAPLIKQTLTPIIASGAVGAIAVPVLPGAIMGAAPIITHLSISWLALVAATRGNITFKTAHFIRFVSLTTLLLATPVLLALQRVSLLPLIAITFAVMLSLVLIKEVSISIGCAILFNKKNRFHDANS